MGKSPENERNLEMIEVDRAGAHWLLRLCRPEKANALSLAMLQALTAAVQEAAEAGIKALILTGAGRVFSAGADLDGMKAGLGADPAWEQLSATLAEFPGLTIAALNGTLAGGAMGMALACDIRIAVQEAAFFYPVMRLGYLPQPSDPGRLVALVGPSRARMILLAGQRIGAEEALAWGLIDRILPAEGLMEAAKALAADALAAPHNHVVAIKKMMA
jgi:enoyl-CoA hydratase